MKEPERKREDYLIVRQVRRKQEKTTDEAAFDDEVSKLVYPSDTVLVRLRVMSLVAVMSLRDDTTRSTLKH